MAEALHVSGPVPVFWMESEPDAEPPAGAVRLRLPGPTAMSGALPPPPLWPSARSTHASGWPFGRTSPSAVHEPFCPVPLKKWRPAPPGRAVASVPIG